MPARCARWSVIAAAAALAVTLSLTSPSLAGNPTFPCRGAQLRAHLLDSSGAAGTIVLSITLQNFGAACWTKGYVGLRLGNAREYLPTRVVHGGLAVLNQVPHRVVLQYGRFATVFVAYNDHPVGSERSCEHATQLLVRLPGQLGWLSAAVNDVEACNWGTLQESPILAGTHHA